MLQDSLRKEKEEGEGVKIFKITATESENRMAGDIKKGKMIDRKLRLCKLAKRVVTPSISLVFISIYWMVGIYQIYYPDV